MILDALLTLSHLLVIGFNLLGWIWPATRKAHFVVVCATAACWLLLGIWYGIGYCPLTDWQWTLKERMGETDLPASFIKYFADKVSGRDIPAVLVDWLTALCFAAAAVLSVYLNFFRRRQIPVKH
ncbi:DUF2784 domain-containing protein [Pedobacter deserti]|uniref:DUF2784 domain-containing protein n=1 Tax=Pedobacter deserti TaxID=2817382 RepID=UPI0021092D85|nr:DUF2784 domain-containing protein [Pedobacter sp. SYSU D00382]